MFNWSPSAIRIFRIFKSSIKIYLISHSLKIVISFSLLDVLEYSSIFYHFVFNLTSLNSSKHCYFYWVYLNDETLMLYPALSSNSVKWLKYDLENIPLSFLMVLLCIVVSLVKKRRNDKASISWTVKDLNEHQFCVS